MSTEQDRPSGLKYVPSKRWQRFGRSSFRGARSLSRSLNSLFHRKHSYSFLKPHKKAVGSYEIINCSGGVSISPLRSPSPSQAHVWGVRHSYTKSAVEDLQFKLDLEQGSSSEESPNTGTVTVQGARTPDMVTAEKSTSQTTKSGPCDVHEVPCVGQNIEARGSSHRDSGTTVTDAAQLTRSYTDRGTGGSQTGRSDSGIDIRGRLQSVGSYCDSLSCSQGCSYSSSPRERSISMSDDWASMDSLDSLDNVSYWDLPIIDKASTQDSASLPGFPRHRRYSESMLKNSCLADGSPRRLTELAHRRMSESIAAYHGSLRSISPRVSDKRDSVPLRRQLLTIRQERDRCHHELSRSTESSPSAIPEVPISSLPRTRHLQRKRSSSDFGLRLNTGKNNTMPRNRSLLCRSRSADFRKLQRQRRAVKRSAFSDIESSDESPYVESNVSSDDVDCKHGTRHNKSISLTSSSKSEESEESMDNRKDSKPRNITYSVRRSLHDLEDKARGMDRCDSVRGIEHCDSVRGMEPCDSVRGMERCDSVEFMSVKDLMFSSGEHGTQGSGGNDMDKVIEAVQVEAEKQENVDKDMMVMFLVGKIHTL